ncbi:unnamed protein product [Brassica oleracea var. botrytis]
MSILCTKRREELNNAAVDEQCEDESDTDSVFQR